MSLKERRQRIGLSQKAVSEALGITRTYLNLLENGKRIVSDELLERLNGYYDNYSCESSLDAKVDYLTVSFKTNDIEKIIAGVLVMDSEYFYQEVAGRRGYIEKYKLENIQVFNSLKGSENGVLIDLSGQGCRNYDLVLDELGESWKDFFKRILGYGGKIARLDIAVDDTKPILHLEDLADRADKGFFWKKFKSYTSIRDNFVLLGNQERTCTLNFGSRSSQVHFTFYKKDLERSKALGIPKEELATKNRYELRFRDKKAMKFVEAYMESRKGLMMALRVVSDYLVFYETELVNDELVIMKDWLTFLGEMENVDLRLESRKTTYATKVRWVENQVSRALKLIREVDLAKGTTVLEDIIEKAELTEKEEKMLESEITNINDWLLKKKVASVIN